MRNFNFIAIFSFYIICSPHAFGQNESYIVSHLAIDKKIETPVSIKKIHKFFPHLKQRIVSTLPILKNCLAHNGCEKGFHEVKPVVVNCRQFARPKIIEEVA